MKLIVKNEHNKFSSAALQELKDGLILTITLNDRVDDVSYGGNFTFYVDSGSRFDNDSIHIEGCDKSLVWASYREKNQISFIGLDRLYLFNNKFVVAWIPVL